MKRNKHLEIIAEKTMFFYPGGSRAKQVTSYDNGNTSQYKPSNIIQIQQQDTKSVIISERNTQHTIMDKVINDIKRASILYWN